MSEAPLVIPDPWECIRCAMCCKRYNPITDSIINCQYLDIETDLCTIYEDRPVACKLDFYSDKVKTAHCYASIASIQRKMTIEALIREAQGEKI